MASRFWDYVLHGRLARQRKMSNQYVTYSGRHQIEAAGAVALLLETAVVDFTQAVEKHGTGQRVARLTLVQPGMQGRRSSTLCSQSKMNSVRSMRPSSRCATARPFWRG
ncbi:MAG: hypothetical protein VR65_05800 [Desulfobulbaceae bacterium BRH_c16a]|nr:MAG: hypothetical protein VR65_05800 [Desulfobulbaceae bacterium BRH_c16a]